ncbi:MAG: FG-GAP repeat protein, partial [Longimicrobiales bacterium]|nr:FG-GAP repeat protein [Longimicrobiales bacterium]
MTTPLPRSRTLLFATFLLALPLSAQEPNFGRAAVIDGDDLLVGQPVNWYGPGTVYAYRPGPDGAWIEEALLTAPDSSRMDDFGASLALDGDRLAVGAPRKRDGVGVVYLFERASSRAGWSSVAVLEAPETADGRGFGTALLLEGDELFVGSPAV